VVNAMQTEHQKEVEEEMAAERGMIHEETANVLDEIRKVQADLAALRQEIAVLSTRKAG